MNEVYFAKLAWRLINLCCASSCPIDNGIVLQNYNAVRQASNRAVAEKCNRHQERRRNMVHSIVTDVLATAGSLHRENLDERVQNVEKKLAETRTEIVDAVRRCHDHNILTLLASASEISKRFDKLSNDIQAEIKRIQNEIDNQPSITAADIAIAKERLVQINKGISALNCLCEFCVLCKDCDATTTSTVLLTARNILSMQEKLKLMESTFNDIIGTELLGALKCEYSVRKACFEQRLNDVWSKQVVKWDYQSSSRSCSLTVLSDYNGNISSGPSTDAGLQLPISEALSAMQTLGILEPKLLAFSQNLLKYFLLPLTKGICKIELNKQHKSTNGCGMIEVIEVCEEIGGKESSRQAYRYQRSPKDIFADLNCLFDFFDQAFDFDIIGNGNDIGQKRRFLAYVGDFISKDLIKSLTQDCLKPAIPVQESGEEASFDVILSEASNLMDFLKKVDFLAPDSKSVLDSAADFDLMFIDKARDLIMDNFLNTTVAQPLTLTPGSEDLSTSLSTEDSVSVSSLSETSTRSSLRFDDNDVLRPVTEFPPCLISASMVDLVKLIRSTLEQAVKASNPSTGARLLQTTRNICELYLDLVVVHHFRNMENLPRFSGIFYNNCMYLANHLTTLGFLYSQQVHDQLLYPQGFCLTFIDFHPRLRQLAAECLDAQLLKQRAVLEDCLTSCNLINVSENEAACESALSKCSSVLSRLFNDWKDVLVPTLLFRVVGQLVQFLLRSLSDCVVKMEDISSDDGKHLVALFERFLVKMEALFKVNDSSVTEICRFCEMEHHRFKELLLVLEGSLQDIVDRWSAGKGPLAVAFSAIEVKSLIRALFQNTERRAQALVQIKGSGNT